MPAQFGPLGSTGWWREVAEAGFRQNVQILLPFLALVSAQQTFDPKVALSVGVAFGVGYLSVVLFRVARVTPGADAHPWVKIGYRALSAAAASAGAAVTADGFDLLHAEGRGIALAAVAAAGTALVHRVIDPPASVVRSESAAGYGS